MVLLLTADLKACTSDLPWRGSFLSAYSCPISGRKGSVQPAWGIFLIVH